MNDNDQWVSIPLYAGQYEVSSSGHVRSIARDGYWNRIGGICVGIELVRFRDSNGYLYVNLSSNGKARKKSVHSLVLMAFVGICPPGYEACHNDGDRLNNALSNLRWDTRKENALDRVRHGSQSGERSYNAKLSEAIALEVLSSKESSRLVGLRLGVASSTVRAIRIGKNWKHLRAMAS